MVCDNLREITSSYASIILLSSLPFYLLYFVSCIEKIIFFFKTIISIWHFQDFYFIFFFWGGGHCLFFIRYFVRSKIYSEWTIAIHLRLLFVAHQGLSVGRCLCLFSILFLEKYSWLRALEHTLKNAGKGHFYLSASFSVRKTFA